MSLLRLPDQTLRFTSIVLKDNFLIGLAMLLLIPVFITPGGVPAHLTHLFGIPPELFVVLLAVCGGYLLANKLRGRTPTVHEAVVCTIPLIAYDISTISFLTIPRFDAAGNPIVVSWGAAVIYSGVWLLINVRFLRLPHWVDYWLAAGLMIALAWAFFDAQTATAGYMHWILHVLNLPVAIPMGLCGSFGVLLVLRLIHPPQLTRREFVCYLIPLWIYILLSIPFIVTVLGYNAMLIFNLLLGMLLIAPDLRARLERQHAIRTA